MHRRSMLRALLAAGMAARAVVAGTAGASAAAASYTVTDLGTLGYISSSGGGLNGVGQASGVSSLATTVPVTPCPLRYGKPQHCVEHPEHAFIYSGGTMTDLGTLGGIDSAATAVNAGGTVVGSADTAAGDSQAASAPGQHSIVTGCVRR